MAGRRCGLHHAPQIFADWAAMLSFGATGLTPNLISCSTAHHPWYRFEAARGGQGGRTGLAGFGCRLPPDTARNRTSGSIATKGMNLAYPFLLTSVEVFVHA